MLLKRSLSQRPPLLNFAYNPLLLENLKISEKNSPNVIYSHLIIKKNYKVIYTRAPSRSVERGGVIDVLT